ncbi:hypothetical protein B0H21DRAFT_695633 [Amylocystis lapponica]|nr:hypothetical protein B0H21DRAFT_695633 [Amylocystis lapponica]
MTEVPQSNTRNALPPTLESALQEEDEFVVDDFQSGSNGNDAVFQRTLAVTSFEIEDLTPHSTYESCAPTICNILHGDDSDDMPFLPFADDPGFDIIDYIREHKRFAWQSANRDPDLNTIMLETARRLYRQRGISIGHIDETSVLPGPLRTVSGAWGSIWLGTQTDTLQWPGSLQTSCPSLPDLLPPKSKDLRLRLQDYLTMFCPNLSCVHADCPSHDDRFQRRYPVQDPAVPAHDPCGADCYLARPCPPSGCVSWSAEDTDALRVILQISQPSKLCDLAVICRKPCREVRVSALCVTLAPNQPHEIPPLDQSTAESAALKFADFSPSNFTPNEPCDHDGPCSEASHCPCFLNKAHCTRGCRCARDCARQWRGCLCVKKKHSKYKPCATDSCPCRRAHRECDPELCTSCEIKSMVPLHTAKEVCRNAQLLKGKRKGVEVKRSNHGLGVFLTEAVREGDLITEYVGELIYEATFETRGQLSNHRGRSYVYGLNASMSNDGTYVGNESRFLNHKEKANCSVSSACTLYLVNGDHRIGVYARKNLPAQKELFLDYGPEFHF